MTTRRPGPVHLVCNVQAGMNLSIDAPTWCGANRATEKAVHARGRATCKECLHIQAGKMDGLRVRGEREWRARREQEVRRRA